MCPCHYTHVRACVCEREIVRQPQCAHMYVSMSLRARACVCVCVCVCACMCERERDRDRASEIATVCTHIYKCIKVQSVQVLLSEHIENYVF